MRERYVMRDGQLVHRRTGAPFEAEGAIVAAPMVVRDIPEYRSPIDGRVIGSRSERADDLKRNNCVEAGDRDLSATGGKFKNKAWCAKRGFTVSEEFR